VISLSSDEAIWDAVIKNVLHQRLLELPDSGMYFTNEYNGIMKEEMKTIMTTKRNTLNCTFSPRILTSSQKWSCLFQIKQNRP